MTEAEVVEVLAIASALFPSLRVPHDPMTLDVWSATWHRQLCDLPRDVVIAVLEQAAAGEDRDFAPAPGQLRLRTLAVLAPQQTAPPLDEAWGEVRREIQRVGAVRYEADVSPRFVTFSHPAIAAVVQAMGWEELGTSTNEVADRAHFARMYEARVEALTVRASTPPAAGAILDELAPGTRVPGIEPGPVRLQIGSSEPIVLTAGPPSQDLLNRVRAIRLAMPPRDHAEPGEPRQPFSWQEGDPIDLLYRGETVDKVVESVQNSDAQ